MEAPSVTEKKKNRSLFWLFLLAILVVIGEFNYGFSHLAPFTTCLILWLGCNWSQLSEGFEVLSGFEKLTLLLFIIGLVLLIGLGVEEVFLSSGPATLTSLWELLTTTGGKGVTGYEIALALLGATAWTLTSVLLKNNGTDVGIFFVVFFALHMWGAQQGETLIYPGSFLSHIWESTGIDITNPNTPEKNPILNDQFQELGRYLKLGLIIVILLFVFRFLFKNLKKDDWKKIGVPTLILGFLLAGLVIAGFAAYLPNDWKVVRLIQAIGSKWKIVLGVGFFLVLLLFYFRRNLRSFWRTEDDEIDH